LNSFKSAQRSQRVCPSVRFYSFADELQKKHPENNFVHAKIRQQLQYLRDKGFVQFVSPGKYRKIR
jgi:type II restriction enzyme